MTELDKQIRQALTRLSLVSHAPAGNLDGSGGRTKPSTKVPTGGIDREEDRDPESRLKSADHFVRRLSHVKSPNTKRAILTEIEEALEAWGIEPRRYKPGDPEPERGTLAWKRMIADSSEPAYVLQRRHEVGERLIERFRLLYRRAPRMQLEDAPTDYKIGMMEASLEDPRDDEIAEVFTEESNRGVGDHDLAEELLHSGGYHKT